MPYATFWIKYSSKSFVANPLGLLEQLRQMPRSEIERRQDAMDRYRADMLYDAAPYRMGSHVLGAATACLGKLMNERHLQRCKEIAARTGGGGRPAGHRQESRAEAKGTPRHACNSSPACNEAKGTRLHADAKSAGAKSTRAEAKESRAEAKSYRASDPMRLPSLSRAGARGANGSKGGVARGQRSPSFPGSEPVANPTAAASPMTTSDAGAPGTDPLSSLSLAELRRRADSLEAQLVAARASLNAGRR